MTKAERQEEVEVLEMVAREVLVSMPKSISGFNNGFLWAIAEVGGKRVKFLVGSADPVSWIDVEIAVRKALPEIVQTYVNMD